MHINIYFLSAVAGVVAVLWETIRTWHRSRKAGVNEIVRHAVLVFKDEIVGPIDKRMVVLETKMDMVIGGIAMNSSTVLHHPEPSRYRVDELIDRFKDRVITEDELEELREHLEFILNWTEGMDAPYTIFPGEQAAAGLMLATMDHVLTSEESNGLPDTAAGSSEAEGTGLQG